MIFHRIKHWIDEFFYLFFCQITLILITGIDFIIHEVLYNYGLRFDYTWANLYWIILTALFWAVAAVGTSAYLIDREKVSKRKTLAVFITLLTEYYGGWLDTVFFIIERLRRGTWGNAFNNWWWHPYSSWFGHWDLNSNLVLNTVTFISLIALWFLVRRKGK